MLPTPHDATRPLPAMVCLVALAFCLAFAKVTQAKEKKVETSTGHFMVWDHFPNEAQARKACQEFASDFRYDPHQYCLPPIMTGDVHAWHIGWLTRVDVLSPDRLFYYGNFYFCPPRERFVEATKTCVRKTP